MKTKFYFLIVVVVSFVLSSCGNTTEITTSVKKAVFNGYIQKGPFFNGTSITISELDALLNQTGRSYSTTVEDNSGSFEQKEIELVSGYIQLKADGYYFNEVSGEASTGQLTLYALADISEVNSANVNVLTHLEKSRAEYLIQKKGMTFANAKKQAQTEVLNIFSLNLPTGSTSESLNLSASGENNAILLAISCILQGTLSTADMSELMANIISDIKTDGTLDNIALGSMLIDNARLINLEKVRTNLEQKYANLGIAGAVIPDFERYVNEFKSKTTYTPVKIISYPVMGIHGPNILNNSVTTCNPQQAYSMKAELPQGTALKIIIKGEKYGWAYAIAPVSLNWTISTYNDVTQSQEFVVTESSKANDIYLIFNSSTEPITIEYYENNSLTPTKTKQITVSSTIPPSSTTISYPTKGIYVNWYNILNDSTHVTYAGKVYAMAAYLPQGKSLKVVLKSPVHNWVINADNKQPHGWTVGEYNATNISQEFSTIGAESDMGITFPTNERVTIEIYENNATKPTKVRYLN